jgi:hypothetical protein
MDYKAKINHSVSDSISYISSTSATYSSYAYNSYKAFFISLVLTSTPPLFSIKKQKSTVSAVVAKAFVKFCPTHNPKATAKTTCKLKELTFAGKTP